MNKRILLVAMSVMLSSFSLAYGATMGKMEYGVDRPGSDYTNFALPTANPNVCENECAIDSGCEAWSYVAPGYQGPNARCWLKNAIPAPVANGPVTSSVKIR